MPHDHPPSARLIAPGLLRPILVDPALKAAESPARQAFVKRHDETPISITVGSERRFLISEAIAVDACTDAYQGPNGEDYQPDPEEDLSLNTSAVAGLAIYGYLWGCPSFFGLGGGIVGFGIGGGGVDGDVVLVVVVLAEGGVATFLVAAGVRRRRREHLC
jgi:hypothetical protein